MAKKTNNANNFNFSSLSVTLVNLGCDKNRVDAEKILYKLSNMGFKIVTDIKKANLIVVNTCAFIKSAIDESEKSIEEVLANKKDKAKVIITGCYAQRFYDLAQKYPVDLVLKLDQSKTIEDYVYKMYNVQPKSMVEMVKLNRVVSTPKHYAFLKISDGCNNCCTYCTIPQIRGRYKSEPMEELIKEATQLSEKGVKELILIAQDVTRYGQDLYGEPRLVDLIKGLSKIPTIECIRLHYCYPEMVTDELIEEIVTNDKVAKYMDIPLQHISDNILKAMHRRGSSDEIRQLITKLKNNNISIRSTFIVGFPQETKQDFDELVKFLKAEKLRYVGFFAYSREENTVAGKMEGQIPEKIKIKRLNKIQKVQRAILIQNQKNQIGKVCKAVCDSYLGDSVYSFRAMDSSPEIDTYIYVSSAEPLNIGEYYTLKIVKRIDMDLQGVIV